MTQTLPNTRARSGREGRRLLESIQGCFAREDYGKFVAIDVDSGEYCLGRNRHRGDAESAGEVSWQSVLHGPGRLPYRLYFKGRR